MTASKPEKTAAYSAIAAARRAGRLNPYPCAVCGLPPLVVAGRQRIQTHHHLGYDPRHHLDVTWLCSKHHGEAHRNTRGLTTRISMDLTAAIRARIEILKKRTNAVSLAEVLRRAIAVHALISEHCADGWTLQIVRDDETKDVEIV